MKYEISPALAPAHQIFLCYKYCLECCTIPFYVLAIKQQSGIHFVGGRHVAVEIKEDRSVFVMNKPDPIIHSVKFGNSLGLA